jgi:hypothetical protein
MSLLRHTQPTLMLGRRPLIGAVPTVHTSGTASTGTTTSITPSYPASGAVNDICFLLASSDNNSLITCPAGWQTVDIVAVDANYSAALFWRRLDGSESGTLTLTRATGGAGLLFAALPFSFRGCVTRGLPYEGLATTSGTSTTATGPIVTTSGINRQAAQFWAWGGIGVSTAPGGWTVCYQVNSSIGNDGSLACERQAAATPRAIAAPSRTLTLSEPYVVFGLALLPA